MSGERYTNTLVIVTSASPFTIMPADAREGQPGYGPRHVGIFASEVVAILVLTLRQPR
jgi:hypothetical protein